MGTNLTDRRAATIAAMMAYCHENCSTARLWQGGGVTRIYVGSAGNYFTVCDDGDVTCEGIVHRTPSGRPGTYGATKAKRVRCVDAITPILAAHGAAVFIA